MPRFSVRMLLIGVAAVAVGVVALVNASGMWARLIFAVAVAANIVALIGAVITRRPGFVGFALAGWVYVLLTATPMLGRRAEWLQAPAVVLDALRTRIERPAPWDEGGLEDDFDQSQGDFLTGPRDPTTGRYTVLRPNPRHMREVAHGLCCLAAGCLGAWVAAWLKSGPQAAVDPGSRVSG